MYQNKNKRSVHKDRSFEITNMDLMYKYPSQ